MSWIHRVAARFTARRHRRRAARAARIDAAWEHRRQEQERRDS